MEFFLKELAIALGSLSKGFVLTLWMSLAAIATGTLAGVSIGVGLAYGRLVLRLLLRALVDAVRGTPVLVLILAAYYLLAFVGVNFSALEAGFVALTIFGSAHISEVTRGALQAIPPAQLDAGRSIGLTFPGVLLFILLPQAIRRALPVWTNVAIELVKASSLLSIIGVGELLFQTQETVGRNFMTMEFYALCGLLYFVINFSIERFGKYAERRLASP
jgi:polar amino acid transport system permease protein